MTGRLIRRSLLGLLLTKSDFYSFDLKSATDRWPLTVIYHLMALLFGPSLASAVVNSTLGLNTFTVGRPLVNKQREIQFICGLGYYAKYKSRCSH